MKSKSWLRKLKSPLVVLTLVAFVSLCFRFYIEVERVSSESIRSWERSGSADCAVVLTGGAHRIREGFDLLNQKLIKKLVISGVFSEASLNEIFPYWSFYENLNIDDIILEKRSLTTYGNAQQSLPIVEALKCRDVLVITSSLHMHRAFKTFKATFPSEVQLYKHSVVPGPTEVGWWALFFEVIKSIFYSAWAY